MMEEKFQKWFESSAIVEWLKLNRSLAEDIWNTAYQAGCDSVWDSLDREMLIGLLEDLDHSDELQQQEELRRGIS